MRWPKSPKKREDRVFLLFESFLGTAAAGLIGAFIVAGLVELITTFGILGVLGAIAGIALVVLIAWWLYKGEPDYSDYY